MAVFKYNKEAQDKYSQSSFERFLKCDKEQEFAIDPKKDGEYRVRILPPWSAEGVFAKGTKVHFRVGLESKTVVCPTVIDAGCEFCHAHAEIKGDEKFNVDTNNVRPSLRYLSNIVNMKDPKIVQVWSYGPQIFFPIKKIQDGGEYGDVTDVEEGRDLIINRQVRGKVTDSVYPAAQPSMLTNPDWLDQIFNLDQLIPEVDVKLVKKLFESHPWKVYEPNTKGRVISVGNTSPVQESKSAVQEVSQAQPQQQEQKLDDIAARLRAKLAEKSK